MKILSAHNVFNALIRGDEKYLNKNKKHIQAYFKKFFASKEKYEIEDYLEREYQWTKRKDLLKKLHDLGIIDAEQIYILDGKKKIYLNKLLNIE